MSDETKYGPVSADDCKALLGAKHAVDKARDALQDAETDLASESLRIRRVYTLPRNAVIETATGRVKLAGE